MTPCAQLLSLIHIFSIAAKDGGTVDDRATLVARPVLTAGKVPPGGSVTYQWWIDRTATGSYEKLAGATKQELKLDSSMVGAKDVYKRQTGR